MKLIQSVTGKGNSHVKTTEDRLVTDENDQGFEIFTGEEILNNLEGLGWSE